MNIEGTRSCTCIFTDVLYLVVKAMVISLENTSHIEGKKDQSHIILTVKWSHSIGIMCIVAHHQV